MLWRGKKTQAIAIAAIWAGLVAVCLWKLRAGTLNVARFGSDSAIPVLMANDRHWDLFQCFFYGQDRFGAWPFLLIRIAGSAAGVVVRWEHLQLALVAWVLIGSVPFARLFPSGRALAAFFYLLPAAMIPELRIFFDLASPYGWQLTTLVLAWWLLRVALEAESATPGQGIRPRTLRWFAAFLFSALATWISPVSGPVLLGLGLVEAWRIRWIAPNSNRPLIGLKSVLPAIGAALFEIVLRNRYHIYSVRHFDEDYRTPVQPDWENLGRNAKATLQRMVEFHWLFLLVLGAAGCLATAVLILRRRSRLGEAGEGPDRAIVDSSFLTLGAGWVAIVQAPFLITTSYVRMNDFDVKYFTLLFFFGSLAGLTAVATAAILISGSRFERWSSALAAIGMVAIAFALPRPVEDPEYARQRRLAGELARRAPGAVLLSDYWETYELSALEPHTLLPLPFDGDYLRTPWHLPALRVAREVIVSHQGGVHAPNLDPVLTQYGTKLYLVASDWYGEYGRGYSLYTAVAPPAGRPTDARGESPR